SSPTRPLPLSTLFPYTTLFRSGILPTASGLPDAGESLVSLFTDYGATSAELINVREANKEVANTEEIASQIRRQKGIFFTGGDRSEEHTSELQSRENLVCRLLL